MFNLVLIFENVDFLHFKPNDFFLGRFKSESLVFHYWRELCVLSLGVCGSAGPFGLSQVGVGSDRL